jgi:hypothetical protein
VYIRRVSERADDDAAPRIHGGENVIRTETPGLDTLSGGRVIETSFDEVIAEREERASPEGRRRSRRGVRGAAYRIVAGGRRTADDRSLQGA